MKTKQYAVCLFITQVEVDDDDDGFENDKYPTLSTHDTFEAAQEALVDVIVNHDLEQASNFLAKRN
jgi:carbamate kinase